MQMGLLNKLGEKAKEAVSAVGSSAPAQDVIDRLAPRTQSVLRKKLAVLDPTQQRCKICKYFDLQAGQQILNQNSDFATVMQVLGPDHHSAMERQDYVIVDGKKMLNDKPSEKTFDMLDGKPNVWNDYGLCNKHSRGEHLLATCEDWTP